MDSVVMSLENYSPDELRKLLEFSKSLQAMAMLDYQRRFAADMEHWLTAELGRRHQAAARFQGGVLPEGAKGVR